MLRSMAELKGYAIGATDGEIGKVSDTYFDDKDWAVRYLIVETGKWLTGRRVLVAPASIKRVDWEGHSVDVSLTRDQVRSSPDVDTAKPITRQHEVEFARYYGWPMYWAAQGGLYGGTLAGMPAIPLGPETTQAPAAEAAEAEENESHLRSLDEVTGYHLAARDGEIGHLSDLLFEDQTWKIQYMVVNTSNWLAGRKVLVSPSWVLEVSWAQHELTIDLKRETIENSPPFDAGTLLGRAA